MKSHIYREMLREKRAEVLSGLGIKFDTLASMGRVAEDDQAQFLNDESVSLHLNRLDYAKLRLIEEALDRLKSGDYGICLCCEEPIPPKRLNAVLGRGIASGARKPVRSGSRTKCDPASRSWRSNRPARITRAALASSALPTSRWLHALLHYVAALNSSKVGMPRTL